MLYLAIPAHNEAATIGVLLWRLRTVLAEFPREYEAVVYDDASNDSTSEILESYARVMPLTVLRGERKVGYAGAVDALVRHVARHTRYPRRDAMLLLQGDFTDSPQLVPEFVKRFEGGTDIVVGERETSVRTKAPTPVRRLLRAEPWLLRFFVKAEGLRDLTSSYRLIRISVLRDLLRTVGDAAVCVGDPRTANADFLMRVVPLARRIEGLPVEPTWDVRLRETRVDAMADGMNLLKWAWRSRGKKAVPSTAPESANDTPRYGRTGRDGRPDLTSDVSVTVAESGRGNLRDASNRSRRNKPARGEGRNESRNDNRNEGRTESRNDARADTRSDSRSDNRAESRTERPPRNDSRPPRNDARNEARREPPVKLVATDGVDDANELDVIAAGDAPTRERPPRRKRSRGRRDRGAAIEGQNTENADASDSSADASQGTPRIDRINSAAVAPDEAESVADRHAEVELSPALSDAVAAAEAELDIPGHTRPARKKRRRRGGRGGRAAGQVQSGDDASDAGDSVDEVNASARENDSADSDGDSDEGSDREFRQSESRRGDFRRGGRRGGAGRSARARDDDSTGSEGGSDFADGADGQDAGESEFKRNRSSRATFGGDAADTDSFDGDLADGGASEGDSADGDSSENAPGAPERGRRRGRRGRRGGSRRSRAARGEASDMSAGDSGASSDGGGGGGGGENFSSDSRPPASGSDE